MAKYGVYIIEFLRANDYCDGDALHEILKASRIPTKYRWPDTVEDFRKHLKDFQKSDYRYLHISCHADETGFELNGEDISNAEIEKYTAGTLHNKRLFLSACKGANRDLASRIILRNGAYSLMGVPVNARFDKSALFWLSFYHLINEADSKKMRPAHISDIVKKCVDLFNLPINYYSRINGDSKHFKRLKIRQGEAIDNRKIRG